MKTLKQLFILVLVLFVSIISHAQINILVQEQEVNMSKGLQHAFIVEIPQADNDAVIKTWSKYIRVDTKSKVQKAGEEIYILGTEIDQIHKGPINIYSVIFKKDSTEKLVAFFEIDSVFFSKDEASNSIENEKTYHGIKNFVRDFALERYREVVASELKDEQKKLKDLTHDLEKFEKDNVSYQKKIKENEQDILNSESEISSLEAAKTRKVEEVENQKLKVTSLSEDAVLQDMAKKKLKELEKEKKGINKDIEKKHKNIVSYQSNIKEFNRLIEDNQEKQEAKLKEIEDQEDIIERTTNKLQGIK
jgi:predicted  nucleic acid-binding Zn-ribbon protein